MTTLSRSRTSSATLRFVRASLAAAVIAAAANVYAQEPSRSPERSTTIKNVLVAREGELTVVTLEADGPLPVPTVGQVESPPRFFLDFAGVGTSTNGKPGDGGAAVRRVRIALHSSEPRVTRAVIDLARQQPIRTEDADREGGRYKILIGAAAPEPAARPVTVPLMPPPSASKPSAPPGPVPRTTIPLGETPPPPTNPPAMPPAGQPAAVVPPPTTPPAGIMPAPAVPSNAPNASPGAPPPVPPLPSPIAIAPRPTAPPLPQRDVERYRGQVDESLAKLAKLRGVLTAIDNQNATPPDGLAAAREELSGVLRALTAVRPPDSIRGANDMLLRAASFALMAVTLRDDAGKRGDVEKLRNAGAAAAGALLLLDRVCADIGWSGALAAGK